MSVQTITIRRPDDWHVHLRDGAMLKAVAPYTARQFARAIVMPNLMPPVTSVAAARGLSRAHPGGAAAGRRFTPLMTCYLTDGADPDEIERGFAARASGSPPSSIPPTRRPIRASGVTDIRNDPSGAGARWSGSACRCCVHGEVTDPDVDVFDREAVFIERVLAALVARLSRR